MTIHLIKIQITPENSKIPHILAPNPFETFSMKRSQSKFSLVTENIQSKLHETSEAYEDITALNFFTAHDCSAVLVTASNCINIYWSIKKPFPDKECQKDLLGSSANNKKDRMNFIFLRHKIESISTAAVIKIQMKVGKTPYINKWKFNLSPFQRRFPWWQSSPPLLSDQC